MMGLLGGRSKGGRGGWKGEEKMMEGRGEVTTFFKMNTASVQQPFFATSNCYCLHYLFPTFLFGCSHRRSSGDLHCFEYILSVHVFTFGAAM